MSSVSHHFNVGTIECIALADSTYQYSAADLFVNAPKDRAEQVVREFNLQPEGITLSYTGLLIKTGHRLGRRCCAECWRSVPKPPGRRGWPGGN